MFFEVGFTSQCQSRTAQTGTDTEPSVQSGSQVFVRLQQNHPAVASPTAWCPAVIINSVNNVFLASSVVEAAETLH